MLNPLENGKDTDPVGDKVGGVFGVDNPFAEPATDEIGQFCNDCRIGILAGDNFQQAHVTWRVEKVRDQEILAHFRRQDFRHFIDRQTAGVGRKYGALGQIRHQSGHQVFLDRHMLDDHFDHPVAALQLCQVVVKITDTDLAGVLFQVERGRLHFQQATQSGIGNPVAYLWAFQAESLLFFFAGQFARNDVQQ